MPESGLNNGGYKIDIAPAVLQRKHKFLAAQKYLDDTTVMPYFINVSANILPI